MVQGQPQPKLHKPLNNAHSSSHMGYVRSRLQGITKLQPHLRILYSGLGFFTWRERMCVHVCVRALSVPSQRHACARSLQAAGGSISMQPQIWRTAVAASKARMAKAFWVHHSPRARCCCGPVAPRWVSHCHEHARKGRRSLCLSHPWVHGQLGLSSQTVHWSCLNSDCSVGDVTLPKVTYQTMKINQNPLIFHKMEVSTVI